MRLLLIGPPGAGKGTQARKLAERLDVPHVASGELLRQAASAGTAIGLKAKSFMDKGAYVPDEIMIWFISSHLNSLRAAHFVLDGIPRTLGQAAALDEELAEGGLPLELVIHLAASDEEVTQRLTGRRTCPTCQRTYHMHYDPPATDEICDDDATGLVTRADDQRETVRRRLDVYHRDTQGLITYYERAGILVTIDALGELDEVSERIDKALEAADVSSPDGPPGGRP